MKPNRALNFQAVLSQGWSAWTLLLLLMIALILERGGVAGPAGTGSMALTIFTLLGAMQVFMSVLLRVFDSNWFRWVNAGCVALITLAFAAHHVAQHTGLVLNGVCGASAEGVFHVVEAAHHVLGILMCVLAVRWARASGDMHRVAGLYPARF